MDFVLFLFDHPFAGSSFYHCYEFIFRNSLCIFLHTNDFVGGSGCKGEQLDNWIEQFTNEIHNWGYGNSELFRIGKCQRLRGEFSPYDREKGDQRNADDACQNIGSLRSEVYQFEEWGNIFG